MTNEIDFWEPFKPIRRLRRRMFDLFAFPEEFSGIREPLIDIVDKGDSLQLIAELPGVDKKDIDITVEENSFVLKAESKHEADEQKKKEGYYFHERTYQSFYRRIPLPTEVVANKATAEFKNGILVVNMPKMHPTQKGKEFKVEVK